MSAIRDALVQYVAVRRALGTKFYEPALALDHFVDFLEHEGAEFSAPVFAWRDTTTSPLPVLLAVCSRCSLIQRRR